MTQFEVAMGVFALVLMLFVCLLRYVNRLRLPCSLCEDIGYSEDGIPCPFCKERRATGAH